MTNMAQIKKLKANGFLIYYNKFPIPPSIKLELVINIVNKKFSTECALFFFSPFRKKQKMSMLITKLKLHYQN